ncbi:hypothetical protein C6P46_000684 [Rhodotorula mucilaginosa]|uniref:Zn(2)-C6 fungal-type domain-containing protein n=1 Tax=Rhodotorula mucilaginosa TaxID=5537 RepID=A0A9P7B2F4_RHOMI|nr:hypothetical protein C6P46_000684 [Rhodotorula mucilaginosa]
MSATDKLGRRRPVKACTECVRSKTKCDRTFPCGACRKKGKAALCSAADEVSAVAPDAVFNDDGAVVGGPDEVHLAARAELTAMRDILASLQPRIVRAEALLNALPPPERAGKRRRLSTDREAPSEAPQSDSEGEKPAELQILDPPERGPNYIGPGQYPFHGPGRNTAILPPSVTNVLTKYPTRSAFAAITPSRLESQVLVNHCMGTLGALHPIINSEARQQHLAHFWVVESPLQLEHCYSSWLASYFAQAAVGARLASAEMLAALGTDHVALQQRADDLTDAALASLYHANFIHNRSLVALQAVAYLALSGRTAETFRAINVLVDHAVLAAQHLRLERDMYGLPANSNTEHPAVRTAALEVRKRVVRALCIANWLYGDLPCISPDKVKGLPPQPHQAEGDTLRNLTPTTYLNFLYDIARIVYRARFLNPTPEQISACLREVSALGETSLPSEDPVRVSLEFPSGRMLEQHRLTALSVADPIDLSKTAVLVSHAESILREIPTLATHEVRHWAILHQVCAAALVIIGTWRSKTAPTEASRQLVELAESCLLDSAAANSIARKSLEAIRQAGLDAQDA